MEDCGENIFLKQGIASSKTKVGKPPTRLQRQAPASLQLDPVSSNGYTNADQTVIPLLSPLVVSPEHLPEAEGFSFPKCGGDSEMSCTDEKRDSSSSSVPGDCQLAGMAGYAEPSTLFNSVFQSKCVLVNDAS